MNNVLNKIFLEISLKPSTNVHIDIYEIHEFSFSSVFSSEHR